MKKYLPWAAIVALLIGLALLPGPKAGATTPLVTLTGVCSAAPGATSVTCTYTVTSLPATTVDVLYRPVPVQSGCTVAGADWTWGGCIAYPEGHDVGTSGVLTFTQTVPCDSTGQAGVDTIFGNPAFPDSGKGYHFIDVTGWADLPGSCPPATTPTTTPTTVPAPPPVTPDGPSPVIPPAAPQATLTPPAATQAPLAFTGAPIWPEVGVALCLIALGLALVRRSVRHA